MRSLSLLLVAISLLGSWSGAQVQMAQFCSGCSVGASIGDVDGDGRGDFALTEFTLVGPAVVPVLYIFSGANLAAPAVTITGQAGDPPFAPRAAGDIDGNGFGDVFTAAGVYCGVTGTLITPIGAFPDLEGPAAIGDVDGDGCDDLAFSWYSGSPFAQGVYVFDGAGQQLYMVCFTASLIQVVPLLEDLDGDGVSDYAIAGSSSPFQVSASFNGRLDIVSGVDGALLSTHQGGPGSLFGLKACRLDDVDGDDITDIAVWAPRGPQLFGTNTLGGSGEIHLISGGTFQQSLLWECDSSCPITPTNLTVGVDAVMRSVGDVDGDGCGDLIAHKIGGSNSPTGPSPTHVKSGRTGNTLVELPAGLQGDPHPLGDLTGDNVSEALITGVFFVPTVVSLATEGVTKFGSGCQSGLNQPVIGTSGSAAPGEELTVNCSGVEPNLSTLLVLGLSDTLWGPRLLPYDLAIAGMPGCELLASPDITLAAVTTPIGQNKALTSITLTAPTAPAQTGLTVFAQWIVINAPGSALFGSTSRGLQIVLQ